MATGPPHPSPAPCTLPSLPPQPLPGRCDPPPPPPTKLSHPQPLVGPSWEAGIVGGGASALPDPHPGLLVLLTAVLSCGGPLEETLVGVGAGCFFQPGLPSAEV